MTHLCDRASYNGSANLKKIEILNFQENSNFGPYCKENSKSQDIKKNLVTFYHHAEFQENRSTTRTFMEILSFFVAGTNDFEMSLELQREVRDRHTVSLAKITRSNKLKIMETSIGPTMRVW